jgi:hypothetical protein
MVNNMLLLFNKFFNYVFFEVKIEKQIKKETGYRFFYCKTLYTSSAMA